MNWLRLQAYFVWHSYKKREFFSADFPELVARDCAQIVRLNALLEQAIQGTLKHAAPPEEKSPRGLTVLLDEIQAPLRKMDF